VKSKLVFHVRKRVLPRHTLLPFVKWLEKLTHIFSLFRMWTIRKEEHWWRHSYWLAFEQYVMLWEYFLKVISIVRCFKTQEKFEKRVYEKRCCLQRRSKCQMISIYLNSQSLYRRVTKSFLGNHVTNWSHEEQIWDRVLVGTWSKNIVEWIVEPELPFFFPRRSIREK